VHDWSATTTLSMAHQYGPALKIAAPEMRLECATCSCVAM
jgi:hypothetical protein